VRPDVGEEPDGPAQGFRLEIHDESAQKE